MIYEALKEKNIVKILSEQNNLRLLPEYGDRELWNSLPGDVKQHLKDRADELKEKEVLTLPATFYLEYARTGNRAIYEKVYFNRREDLMVLVMAECIWAKGEYVDAIMNLVWAICEETSWILPAHDNNNTELPDIERLEQEMYIDLMAAETGAAISWVYYFLSDVIARDAPALKRRMEVEIDRRIITPYLKFNHFWYMGLENDGFVNNWNPWINSNVIVAFAVFLTGEKDRERLIRGIKKTAKSTDAFIRSYCADGACDEGPSYFSVAGASLFDYLEILYELTGGEINIYGNELIKNIARYIYRVYIGGDYFVNFADSAARPVVPLKLLARIGEAIGDDNLISFAGGISNSETYKDGFSLIYRTVKSMFQKKHHGKSFAPPKTHWFAGTQILTARDNNGDTNGMFVAAKGGHNAESHNHNDLGNFILFSGGKPVIIDAGVETYTKKTFSPQRYEIWTMQSCYHNVPTINGYDQTEGGHRRALDVKYSHNGNTTVLSMQLKDAYPDEAEIESYVREFTFEHGKSITVRDKYRLNRCATPFVLNLLCAAKPMIAENGILLGENIEMRFNLNGGVNIDIDEIELTDTQIRDDWQRGCLYRLRLTEKEMRNENDVSVFFEQRPFLL